MRYIEVRYLLYLLMPKVPLNTNLKVDQSFSLVVLRPLGLNAEPVGGRLPDESDGHGAGGGGEIEASGRAPGRPETHLDAVRAQDGEGAEQCLCRRREKQ